MERSAVERRVGGGGAAAAPASARVRPRAAHVVSLLAAARDGAPAGAAVDGGDVPFGADGPARRDAALRVGPVPRARGRRLHGGEGRHLSRGASPDGRRGLPPGSHAFAPGARGGRRGPGSGDFPRGRCLLLAAKYSDALRRGDGGRPRRRGRPVDERQVAPAPRQGERPDPGARVAARRRRRGVLSHGAVPLAAVRRRRPGSRR
mmetsp:Transcript_31906/g.102064  ORF Transcript_31906/g.102064 Transcript_31906/m.102064 type:complete len:205 (+) Transcript_31906:129-743(+)